MKLVVICSLCFGFVVAGDTYKAGVSLSLKEDLSEYTPLIYKAGEANVDILVLPTKENVFQENYEEAIKTLSESAKQAGIYVIANVNEKVRCQNKLVQVRNNLVIDRKGNVIVAYRKSFSTISNCTNSSPATAIVTFTTDFGVTFGLFTEEDMVLRNTDELKSVKNYVVIGSWSSEVPHFSAPQFSPAFAYINKANVISGFGISGSNEESSRDLMITDLKKSGVLGSSLPVTNPVNLQAYPDEDLSQYIIRPLKLEASSRGYKETVCHNKLCCDFYVKTSAAEAKLAELSYGLAAFDGVRRYGHNQFIGAQNCAIFACAGLYKRSCTIGSDNSTNIFEKIKIAGNFTKENSAQYPMLLTTSDAQLTTKQFKLTTNPSKLSAELTESTALSFGIIGRVYSRDYERYADIESHGLSADIYDYFFNDNTQEFFDYLWIRIRILMVVVSIYVLEMM